MNHTLVKELPHVGRMYNRSRYIDRLYKSDNRVEVYKVLCHGIIKKNLDADDVVHIYCNADRRILDDEIKVANWIMEELGPTISKPGPVSLAVFLETK